MFMLFLQTLIFIAVAFALGCLAGCWLRSRKTASGQTRSGAAAAITHEGAARTVTASELAAPRPHYEPATTPQAASLAPGLSESGQTPPPGDKISAAATDAGTEPAAKPAQPKAAPAPKKAAGKRAAGKSAAGSKRTDRKTAAAASATGAKTSSAKAPAAKAGSGAASSAKPSSKAGPTGKPAAKTAAKPAAKAKPGAAAVADDLKQIKGVGPQLEAKLNAIGINSFAQIASWTKKDQAAFGEQLFFQGRVERDQWVAQAKVLAKGGTTAFSKRVAKGEVPSSAGAKRKRGTPKGA